MRPGGTKARTTVAPPLSCKRVNLSDGDLLTYVLGRPSGSSEG